MKKGLICLAVAALAFAAGMYVGYKYYDVPELKAELAEAKLQTSALHQMLDAEQNKPPQIITETKTKTEIAYVPKETVIYRDAVTGETITAQEKTDVQLDVKPPTVAMQYNGKNYELPGIAGETSKFEKGKLVGEITTMATLDVTQLVDRETARRMEAEKKYFTLGGYATNQGFVGSIGLVRGDREYKVLGALPNVRKFFGAGIEVKF